MPENSSPITLCIPVSASLPEPYKEPLGLAVAFGSLDFIGFILTFFPEPTCQIAGICLSLPSRVVWVGQCIRYAKQTGKL
jgi:hypothetical protein